MTELQASDLAATEEALVMFRYKVRRALRDQQGYECQEADGDFMLAFSSPCDAARFCLAVHLLPDLHACSDMHCFGAHSHDARPAGF